MARIIYPETFADQQILFLAIVAQNKLLGPKSPLPAFLKKQNQDLSKLMTAVDPAAQQNTASGSLKRDSENDTQQRNAALALPWEHLLGEVQFLKHFYAGMERELGEWGIQVDAQARIVYPAGVAAQVALIQTFLAYHQSFDPGESPLQFYIDEHEINVEADLQNAAAALTEDTSRNTATGSSELATQQRNKLWEPVVKAIHLIGAYLMNLYHEDSRKMAAWGFTIVEDAPTETVQTSTIDPATSKNITGIKVPSILTNVGTEAIQVIKGKGDKSIVTTVEPGKQLGMTKGYSKITVSNPSTLSIAKVQVVVSK